MPRYRIIFISSRPDERGVSRSSRSAGRDAVDAAASGRTRGRRAQARLMDARLVQRARPDAGRVRDHGVRRTTTLRGAGRGGDSPHLHRPGAPAQVALSRRIALRHGAAPRRFPIMGRRAQKSPQRWSPKGRTPGVFAKQAEKTTARGTPDVSGAFVVTNSCACFHCA